MDKRLKLSDYGAQLWTREKAREIRAKLEKILTEAHPGETVTIDVKGVDVFDYSFANELFGKTLLRLPREHPNIFLVVENLNNYTRENLSRALESLNLVMIERKSNRVQLLGKKSSLDEKTFFAIINAKSFINAMTLKDELGISLNAVNERLTKLSNLALVGRDKEVSPSGRQQYTYYTTK